MLPSQFDIVEFKEQLKQMRLSLQEGIKQTPDAPSEIKELITASSRLEKELNNDKNQQLLSDFLFVFSFMVAMGEDEDEDFEDEDFEDEDFEEEEED